MRVLRPHAEDVASSPCLVPVDIDRGVIFSPDMSADKVTELLRAVRGYIPKDYKFLLRFAEVLKKEGTFLKLMGDRLENTYKYYCECNVACV